MIVRFLALAFCILFFASSSNADHRFVGAEKLSQIIAEYSRHCNFNTCQEPYSTLPLFNRAQQSGNLLSAQEYLNLQKISIAQAQIWADTILESDYVTDGETKLDEVIGIVKSNELVAYKIRYSEKAWDLSTCNYDPKFPGSIKNCREGFIQETSFVSLDFNNYVRNQNDIADFYIQ